MSRKPVVTPTTKGGPGEHDERLSSEEVVSRGLVPAKRWDEVREAALEIFRRGTEAAARAGLVLVDTKYEFGLIDGRLVLIDEDPTLEHPAPAGTYVRLDPEPLRTIANAGDETLLLLLISAPRSSGYEPMDWA